MGNTTWIITQIRHDCMAKAAALGPRLYFVQAWPYDSLSSPLRGNTGQKRGLSAHVEALPDAAKAKEALIGR